MADWNRQNSRYPQLFRHHSYNRRPNDRSYNRESSNNRDCYYGEEPTNDRNRYYGEEPTNDRNRYYGEEPSRGSSFYNRGHNKDRNFSYDREFTTSRDFSSYNVESSEERNYNVGFNQNSYGHTRYQDFPLSQYGFQSKNEEEHYGVGGRTHTYGGNKQFHRDDIKSRNAWRGRGKFRGEKMFGKRNAHSQSTQVTKQKDTSENVKSQQSQSFNVESLKQKSQESTHVKVELMNKSTKDNESECEDRNADKQEFLEKLNQFIPDESLKTKYKFCPPTEKEMGEIFEGLVIFFFHNVNNIAERNPFVVVCESFRRSDRFASLMVEDGYQNNKKMRKFCTLRWNDIMMARGVSEAGNLMESRMHAGEELINKLAMTCYSLKMKSDYFSSQSIGNMLAKKEVPGVFRIVTKEEAHSFDAACNFITNFFKKDSDCELVFLNHIIPLKVFARAKGYDCRATKNSFVVVFIRRTPQYWRDKILASGKAENEKFELTPPLGLGSCFGCWSCFVSLV